jgi:hypothetical protein
MNRITPTPHPAPGRRIPTWMALGALALLAACGGQQDDPVAAREAETARAAEAQADANWRARAQRVVAPLISDEGAPMPPVPAAVPADTGARTRAGHYATEQQARVLEAQLGTAAIRTDTDTATDDLTAVELAVLMVYGQQDAHGLNLDTPVLVRGRDMRLAAAAANRLADQGYTRVFLVHP